MSAWHDSRRTPHGPRGVPWFKRWLLATRALTASSGVQFETQLKPPSTGKHTPVM